MRTGADAEVSAELSRRDLAIPHTERGQRIGLFGGSFNPAHAGHLLVAETALRRLRLDRLWWIVSPGNPLKDHGALRPLSERIEGVRRLAGNSRMAVTAFEAGLGLSYTSDTLALLARRRPGVNFVVILGGDSFVSLHRWHDWRRLAAAFPIAVVDRPGSTLSLAAAPAARVLARARLGEGDAARLAARPAPAFVVLHGRRSALSSTLLRAAGALDARSQNTGASKGLRNDLSLD